MSIIQSFLNDPSAALLTIITRIPAVVIGFTIHEFCHALAADRLGDPTPRNMGRLTLNPASHVSLWGFIMLLLFGFGWAKPVMVRPGNFKNRKMGDVIVSLAGPLSNLLLAFVVLGVIYFVPMPEWLYMFVAQLYSVNLMLFAFNLMPIPPLDGYNVLKTFFGLKNLKLFWWLEQYGMLVLFGLSFLGVLGTVLSFLTGFVSMGFSWFYGLFG